ncbi:glycosyltransferase [Geomesophilobacter sediminis]|uniref:Glycosyltransferase n=1 Tax=Geomesophilobacter sediminis TaxID=2798584 RepID=A0A8J7LXT3_9BACT|nr:glycosyltransferase [Geomesophilobacter sediminis]MBJ6723697.1 glycosyltransferase [Geomesophilobacter sediminis]
MKILHLIDSGGMYGAETMLLGLMAEQLRLGLHPILGSIAPPGYPEKPVEAEARRRGLTVVPFRMVPGPNPAGALAILSFAWRERVQILHSHGYKGDILFGFLPRWLRRLPLVSTLHGWTGNGQARGRLALYEWLHGVVLSRVERVVVVNRPMQEHPRLKQRRVRVEVVPNGIAEPAPAREALDPALVSFCAAGFVIGAIGRLSPEKGFDLLLEAVAGLVAEGRDLRLVVVGEGELRGELTRKARELGLEGRFLLPGFIPDGRRCLALFHLFAISSSTEGLPMTLLEAMQARVPVVATGVGGIPEALGEGACGVVTEVSAGALRQGIREVIDHLDAAAERAHRAQLRVAEHYSSRAMAARYLEIYRRAVR